MVWKLSKDGYPLVCGFCGKPHDQVKMLIAGAVTMICDCCVAGCAAILAERSSVVPEFKAEKGAE